MEKIVLISATATITCIIIEVRNYIKGYKARKMLKKTIKNCLNIAKEREKKDDRY